ncbi:helix-turn-helix domain-containing protein [Croceimicrobium sp.]|uniref:AraC family transcriptional regulator n=1 Tax=Croceimicrobium sp. TaxID=2828340 RepID=UPI003BAAD9DA
MPNYLQQPSLTQSRDLKSLVENRTTYSHNQFELNVFETHLKAHEVELQFQDFVFTSMFRGKKVMHLEGKGAFDYLPGESVIIAPGEKMVIDFPEACEENPTQCLAIEIGDDLISKTADLLNEKFNKPQACGDWSLDMKIHHLLNGEDLANALNRLVHLSVNEQAKLKDALLDLAMQEMIIRLMQTQARSLLIRDYKRSSVSNPMSAAVDYLSQHLTESIAMKDIAAKACMSRAKFFAKFKEMYGETPARFLQRLRLEKARQLLLNTEASISEVAMSCGFENLSHFTTAFKKETGQTPGQYRKVDWAS